MAVPSEGPLIRSAQAPGHTMRSRAAVRACPPAASRRTPPSLPHCGPVSRRQVVEIAEGLRRVAPAAARPVCVP